MLVIAMLFFLFDQLHHLDDLILPYRTAITVLLFAKWSLCDMLVIAMLLAFNEV